MSALRTQQRTFITLVVFLLILSTVSFLNVNRNALSYIRSTPSQQSDVKLVTSIELEVASTTTVADKTTGVDNIATASNGISSSSSSTTTTSSSILQDEPTGESTSHNQFFKYSYYDPTSNSFKVIYKQQPQLQQRRRTKPNQRTNIPPLMNNHLSLFFQRSEKINHTEEIVNLTIS